MFANVSCKPKVKMEVLDRWLEDGSLTGLAGEGRFMSGGRPRVPLRGDVDDAYC